MNHYALSPPDRLQALLVELEHLSTQIIQDEMQDKVRDVLRTFAFGATVKDDQRLADCAAELYRIRRRRERQIGRDLLGEPCWDLLLDLFANTVRGIPVSVTGACIASNVPTTTALRWISVLEERGLVDRYPDPFDRRVVLVKLTDDGMDKMRTLLEETADRGLTPRDTVPRRLPARR